MTKEGQRFRRRPGFDQDVQRGAFDQHRVPDVGGELGMNAETLRKWIGQAPVDAG